MAAFPHPIAPEKLRPERLGRGRAEQYHGRGQYCDPDMQLGVDVVKDGRDGQTDEWLMEVGIEMRNEQTHAILKLV